MSRRRFLTLKAVATLLMILLPWTGHAEETPPPPSTHEAEAHILAIVNGNVITEADIDARLSLLLASSGMHPPEEALLQIRRTILQTLIEEHLKIQEARRVARFIKNPHYISDADVQRMLSVMIRRSGLSPELFEDFLKRNRIPRFTLVQQARAHVSWSKVINDLYGGSIQVSDQEAERLLARAKEHQKQGAVLLSRIVLPCETPEQEKASLAEMGRLVALLQQGASFPVLAQQFSKAPEAFKGGDLGWITEDQLSEVERGAVKILPTGQISPPLLKHKACVLLLCRDRRLPGTTTTQEVTIQRFLVPAPYALDSEEAAQIFVEQAQEVRAHLLAHHDPKKTEQEFSGLKILPEETFLEEEIDQRLKTFIVNIPTGDISPPIVTPDGVMLIAVRKRRERPIVFPTKDLFLEQTRDAQLGGLAERHLRHLKRTAYIEIRA